MSFAGLRIGFLFALAAKLHQQPAFAFGQQLQVVGMQMMLLHEADQFVVQTLQSDRPVLHDHGAMIARLENIGITKHEERTRLRIRNQLQRRLQHRHTRSFAAGQRPGDVKSFFRQKVVQVVTGNAPGNLRKPFPNERRVFVAQRFQLPVNFACAARRD